MYRHPNVSALCACGLPYVCPYLHINIVYISQFTLYIIYIIYIEYSSVYIIHRIQEDKKDVFLHACCPSNLQDALNVARNILLEGKLLPGGGAAEMAVAARLMQKAKSRWFGGPTEVH